MEELVKIVSKLESIFIQNQKDIDYIEEYIYDHNIELNSCLGSMDKSNWNNGPDEIYAELAISSGNIHITIRPMPASTLSEVSFVKFIIDISNIADFKNMINKQFNIAINRAYDDEEDARMMARKNEIKRQILEEK